MDDESLNDIARIAKALERIAKVLEQFNNRGALLVQKRGS